MKSVSAIAIACASAAALSGCARLEFYSTPELSGDRTGIKFYTPKPYLLVARTGNKEKPVEVSVVYLPDQKNPVYARPRSGLGSSNLTLSLSNGVLTGMGQQTDTKIPELLTSFGGLATSLATAQKTRKETELLAALAAVDYSAIAKEISGIAAGLEGELKDARAARLLTPNERQVLDGIAKILRRSASSLSDPANAEKVTEDLRKALETWDQQISGGGSAAGGEASFYRNLDALKKQLQGAIAKLTPKAAEQPTFTLYEIDNSSGTTTLREVRFP